MNYIVPKEVYEKFIIPTINKYNKKGACFTCSIEEKTSALVRPNTYVDAYRINLRGSYKVNGWRFVAMIEHCPKGNIIRKIDLSLTIPEKYYSTKPYCEHCHTERDRKFTCLIYNDETKEFKQVGKSCLKDFTEGLDADTCQELIYNFIDTLSNKETLISFVSPEEFYYDEELTKLTTIKEVKENGYLRINTSKKIINEIGNNSLTKLKEEYQDELEKINKWVKTQTAKNEYMMNAINCWNKDTYADRHISLLASLVSCYYKQLNYSKINSNSSYLGNEKDKVEFKVKSSRVLFTKYFTDTPTYVQELIDENNNVIIWSTTKLVDNGNNIKATIKELKEYNGIKQTVITRGYILG